MVETIDGEQLVLLLFNMANILFCAAYVTRNILWLRIITVIACLSTFPYFLTQDTPLYSALFWNSTFILLNAFNIAVYLYERRPVVLTDEERRLHLLVFSALTPRAMLKLFSFAEWRDVEPDTKIIAQATIIDELLLIYKGNVRIDVNGAEVAYIKGGGFVGEMSYLTGQETSADVVCVDNVRYLCWEKSKLDAFLAKESAIKNILQAVLGHDMAKKLKK